VKRTVAKGIAVIEKIKSLLGSTITMFMRTWCEDSKAETPRLYKILDATGFDYKHSYED